MIPLISDYYLEEFDLNFPLKKKLISYALENRDNSLFEELIPLNNLLLNEPSIQIDQSELIRFYVQKITKPQLAKIKKYQSYHHDGQKIERQPSNESLDFFTLYPESLNDFTNSSSCFNLSHQELDFKPDNLLQDVRVAQISKTICDAKQTIVMVSRHVVDERGQVVKNNFRVNLDKAVISYSDDNQHIYNITAGTVHIGDSWHSGHYKSFLKVSKDQQELWVCYNDSSIEIVDSSKLNANGIPIELEEKCYFLQYSRSGVELAKFEEISVFGNAGNHCWLNSATVFMQSFEDFRNFVKSLSNEEHSEIDLDLFQALKRFKQETEEEREKAKRETSPSLEVQSSKMPLIEAVNEKNKELVEAILFSISEKSKAEFVDKQESDGTTALHLAVLKDDIEIANILLKNGANIYITDKHGNSPLSLAFEHKRTNFISAYKELIKLDIAKTPKQTIQLAKGNEITRTPDLLTSNTQS